MPNLNLPTNITPGVTGTFETDVEAAWAELNRMTRDTGWRDVTSLLTNGWKATKVLLRRIDDRVFWELETLDGSTATTAGVMSNINGFRARGTTNETPLLRGTGGVNGYIRFSGGTIGAEIGFKFPSSTIHSHQYFTTDTWPATLPGIEA